MYTLARVERRRGGRDPRRGRGHGHGAEMREKQADEGQGFV